MAREESTSLVGLGALGCRVWGFGLRVWGFGLWVKGFQLSGLGVGFGISDFEF